MRAVCILQRHLDRFTNRSLQLAPFPMSTVIAELEELAYEVYHAIEELARQRDRAVARIESYLRTTCRQRRFQFPHNWCDFASCVLAGHIARGLPDCRPILLVKAQFKEGGGRHWWLRHSDIDVDITCGQFIGAPQLVVARESQWHRTVFDENWEIEFCSRHLQVERFELYITMLAARVDDLTSTSRTGRAVRLWADTTAETGT